MEKQQNEGVKNAGCAGQGSSGQVAVVLPGLTSHSTFTRCVMLDML